MEGVGGSQTEVGLDEFMKWVKGFVDLLVLASGYQSSGRLAVWDADNVKKAIQWGVFFENVLKRLKLSNGYCDFAQGLDAALLEFKKNPSFPPGLASLSPSTLSKASDFVLWHFLQGIRLRNDHLTAFITAAVEMDLDRISKTEVDCLNYFAGKLAIDMKSLNLEHVVGSSDFSTQSFIVPDSPSTALPTQTDESKVPDRSNFVIQELLKRQDVLSCLSSMETAVQELFEVIKKVSDSDGIYSTADCDRDLSFLPRPKIKGCNIWSHWRSEALLYLINKRTVRLVSSSNSIFSAPPEQWTQVFDRLRASAEAAEPVKDNTEILELLLLGLISSRWHSVLEQVSSLVGKFPPFNEQHSDLHKFCQRKTDYFQFQGPSMKSKENEIINYFVKMLAGQPRRLWSLPPVLAAAAIPSWSSLFSLYMAQIDNHISADSGLSSCCTCTQNGKEHEYCELAERIWCMYIFHVRLASCP